MGVHGCGRDPIVLLVNVDAQSQSTDLSRYQMAQRRFGGVSHKPDVLRDIDQNRPTGLTSSRGFTAYHYRRLFTLQYPAIPCGDGNVDVKPDHPSGPGRYGHAA
jgi:hypothetical protein